MNDQLRNRLLEFAGMVQACDTDEEVIRLVDENLPAFRRLMQPDPFAREETPPDSGVADPLPRWPSTVTFAWPSGAEVWHVPAEEVTAPIRDPADADQVASDAVRDLSGPPQGEALALLRKLEWSGSMYYKGKLTLYPACPECLGIKPRRPGVLADPDPTWFGHRDDCALARLLSRATV